MSVEHALFNAFSTAIPISGIWSLGSLRLLKRDFVEDDELDERDNGHSFSHSFSSSFSFFFPFSFSLALNALVAILVKRPAATTAAFLLAATAVSTAGRVFLIAALLRSRPEDKLLRVAVSADLLLINDGLTEPGVVGVGGAS